jgi:hypothetical protein
MDYGTLEVNLLMIELPITFPKRSQESKDEIHYYQRQSEEVAMEVESGEWRDCLRIEPRLLAKVGLSN